MPKLPKITPSCPNPAKSTLRVVPLNQTPLTVKHERGRVSRPGSTAPCLTKRLNSYSCQFRHGENLEEPLFARRHLAVTTSYANLTATGQNLAFSRPHIIRFLLYQVLKFHLLVPSHLTSPSYLGIRVQLALDLTLPFIPLILRGGEVRNKESILYCCMAT